jgi:hypothetical protein
MRLPTSEDPGNCREADAPHAKPRAEKDDGSVRDARHADQHTNRHDRENHNTDDGPNRNENHLEHAPMLGIG